MLKRFSPRYYKLSFKDVRPGVLEQNILKVVYHIYTHDDRHDGNLVHVILTMNIIFACYEPILCVSVLTLTKMKEWNYFADHHTNVFAVEQWHMAAVFE